MTYSYIIYKNKIILNKLYNFLKKIIYNKKKKECYRILWIKVYI